MTYARITAFIMVLLSLTVSGFAQANRYMVFFRDKAGSLHSTDRPLELISQKALERRVKEGIAVSEQDFPVNASYVQGVENTGADVFFSTRWMNGVLIQCTPDIVPSIEALSFVDHVEFVAPQARLMRGGKSPVSFRKKNSAVGSETQTQLQMLGIPDMHADGYRGEGITIAIFDGGFFGVNNTAPFQHIFSEGRFDSSLSHDFVQNTKNVFQYDDHGTEVFSVIAGFTPDIFTGGAYEANFQLYVTEEVGPEYRVEEYNWLFAAERADSAGVDIISSSLGYYDFDMASMNYSKEQMDGKTTVITRAAQWAADRGIFVVCSGGNEGNIAWRMITAPADAVDVIAVANVTTQGTRNPSSSVGPSADGRIKPDLAALGTSVRTISGGGALDISSGTSLSTPLITSLVAGVRQRFPGLTRTSLIEALKRTASKADNPDNETGYGIPNYKAVVNYLEHKQQSNVFEVYPNPVADTLSIRPYNPEEITSCQVELVSSHGQLIGQYSTSFDWLNNVFQTDISHLADGLYYVRVRLGKEIFMFKIVKQ